MINESYIAIAVGAITLGAFLSTWVGKKKSGETYDFNQFMSSFIIAMLGAFASIQYDRIAESIQTVGYIGTAVAYIVAGFVLDKGLSKLDTGNMLSFSKRASKGSGVWGLQNTVNSLNNRIARYQMELANSEKELADYQGMPEGNPMKQLGTWAVTREIRKTKAELQAVIDEKADLERQGWI